MPLPASSLPSLQKGAAWLLPLGQLRALPVPDTPLPLASLGSSGSWVVGGADPPSYPSNAQNVSIILRGPLREYHGPRAYRQHLSSWEAVWPARPRTRTSGIRRPALPLKRRALAVLTAYPSHDHLESSCKPKSSLHVRNSLAWHSHKADGYLGNQ